MRSLKYVFIALYLIVSSYAGGQDLYNIDTVRTGYLNFYDINWQTILDSFKTNNMDDRVLADLTVDGILMDSVGVRFKGNSSYTGPGVKKPFNIKLDFIKNQDLYGFTSLKLNNIFKDPSCVREALSYEMLRNYMPASQANYMQLYIDGMLHGLYTSVESVNNDFITKHFGSDNNSFFKCDPIWGAPPTGGCPPVGPGKAALIDQGMDTACYKTSYDIKSDAGWLELVGLIQLLNFNTTQVEQALDVDRALWMLAYNNIFVNFDSYTGSGHNYYIYENAYNRFNVIFWDLNENFGVFKNGGSQPPTNLMVSDMQNLSPFWNELSNAHPLIKQLLADADYKKRYMAHFRTLVEELLASNAMKNRAVEIQSIIDSYVANDPNSLYGYNSFQNGLNQSPNNIVGINVLMDARYSYLSTNTDVLKTGPSIANIVQSLTTPTASDSVWVTATITNSTAAWLKYKNELQAPFQAVQLYDDGTHNDGVSGDGVFGGMIPAQSPGASVYYYLYAENNDAGMFSPKRAEYEIYEYAVQGVQLATGDLVINEFMASNSSTVLDLDGQSDDWIELYNNTSGDISLYNMALSDDALNPSKWRFPDTTIAPNGFIIIWADNDIQTGLHANFKLSSSGEDLILSNSDGTVLDSVSFGAQTADITTGRFPNGTGNFQVLQPTFNAVNTVVGIDPQADATPGYIVYPNPAYDLINVVLNNVKSTVTDIHIYNTLMQRLLSIELEKGQDRVSIPTQELSPGIYFLVLDGQSQRFVIAKQVKFR